jgi:hypothetical protein
MELNKHEELNKMEKIKTWLSFEGFYCSNISERIDYEIQQHYETEDGTELEIPWDKIDYFEIYSDYSSKLIKALNYELDTNMQFLKLDMPKTYNFSSDTIDLSMDRGDILMVFNFIRENKLKSKVLEQIIYITTWRDGFIPFNTFDDYFKKENIDKLVAVLLEIVYDYLNESYPLVDEFYVHEFLPVVEEEILA